MAPLAISVLVTALVGAYAWPYTVDDAFIVARFARNLVEHGHYGMNLGATADGVTGPLWLVPGVIGAALGVGAVAGQKAAGLIAAAVAHGMAVAIGDSVRARWLTVLAVAVSASAGIWAAAGLETGAAALVVAGVVLAALRGARWLWLPLLCAPWIRPELVPSLAVFVALARPRGWGPGVLILAASVAAVAAFRALLFGSPVPLALLAKQGSVAAGLSYVALGALVTTWIVGIGFVWLGRVTDDSDARAVRVLSAAAAALLAHALAVALAGGDWMPGFRLLVPWLPVYAWLFGRGAARFTAQGSRRGLRIALVALPLLLAAVDAAVQLRRARDSGLATAAEAPGILAWLRSVGGPVALADVGRVVPHEFEVVDLGGVTDARVARLPGGHMAKALDVGYLAARAPRVILLGAALNDDLPGEPQVFMHPVERALARHPWFRSQYRFVTTLPLNERYQYAAYVRVE